MMKTSWGKPVHVIRFCRTLMIVLAVAVCLATLMGCGNSPEKDASPAADGSIETKRKAAEAGDAEAQLSLAVMYLAGFGVPKDYAEAVKWYRMAAEQGHADGKSSLGQMYRLGWGVRKDYAEAVKWLRIAAEQGHIDAQKNLGEMYEEGEGVPEDDVVAYAWFSVAAAFGHAGASFQRDSIKGRLTPSQLDRGQVMAREIYERIEKRKAVSAE